MERYTHPKDAVESGTGNFIDASAVESLLSEHENLLNARREFEGAIRILHDSEHLTFATVLNLATSIKREIREPSLAGRRYQIDEQASEMASDGALVPFQDAERLFSLCTTLFDECETLQDAVRSEVHRTHSQYLFVRQYEHSGTSCITNTEVHD